ncbi:MAG: dihydrolipoyllysine-residue succinyltransferase [Acidobacteria bacterium]|nr:MAG: dihydrolipoyllysine-residue succinyltransferase [Acidobacteriota bacterium]
MPTNVIMPQMGESIAEGTITKWLKKVGERVERDEPLFEISTDKVDAEIPAPAAGMLAKILVQENETVPVNAVVALIDGEGAEAESGKVEGTQAGKNLAAPAAVLPPASTAVAAPPGPAPSARGRGEKVRSSPLVRRLARERGVDLSLVRGTGFGGRISKKDVLVHLAEGRAARGAALAAPPEAPTAPLPVAPKIVFEGPTHVVPMTPMRRQIAEHMLASKRTSAHVTTVFEVEMTKVVEMRERHAQEFERRNGLKLTYTPFLIRAALEAIREFPIFNSSLEATNIVYKRDVNIGVAVALETGLIVPVIKRADEKNFLGIARAVQDLAERARSKRLSVEDVQGGTFTITNPGVFGSLLGTPIINQPQVAILGVGVIEKRPVVRNDAIAIRPMVYLALSFDHRVIDGAVADQFMGRVKQVFESWEEPVL